jgi:phosphate-selective porin
MKNTLACFGLAFLVALLLPAGSSAQSTGDDAAAKIASKKKKKKKSKKKAKAKVEQSSTEDDTLDKKYSADVKEKPAKRYFRFEFKRHPAIRMGKWFRMDFRLKFQHDFRSFGPEVSTDEGELSNLRKFRVGIQGYVTKDFEYEIEREIRDDISDLFHLRDRPTLALWRDVYGNWRYFRKAQIRAGQFKIPFGMDQLHNSGFVYRSLIGNFLAPGREVGIMAHGKLFDSRIAYQAGLFEHDGWKAHTKDHGRSGEGTFAGRVVLPPFNLFKTPAFLRKAKDLELGFAFTESPLTEGLRSLRGRTWVITHNWFDRIDVRGHRLRLGAELNWQPGPFTVQGEVIRVRDQRLGQGIRGEDLPDLIARGWYFTTGWVVTGEKPAGGIVPRRDFIKGRGFGAVQLAARYEQLRFGSSEHPGLPSRSSRAANIFSTSERIATFGTNWYPNRFVTVQFNAIREVLEDPNNAPIPGVDTYWSKFVRIQFSF